MRKLILLALLALMPTPLYAQNICVADVCQAATATHAVVQTSRMADHNAAVCATAGLGAACTQAEFDAACPSVSGCNPAQTVYAQVKVYFLDKVFTYLDAEIVTYEAQYRVRMEIKWADHGTETAPNGQCTGVGLPTGCTKREVACLILNDDKECK